MAVTEPVFSIASGFYYKWQWQNLGLSVFLEKLEAWKLENFTNGSDKVCAAVCFWWSFRPLLEMSVKESVIGFVFSKVLGLY